MARAAELAIANAIKEVFGVDILACSRSGLEPVQQNLGLYK